MNSCMVMTRSYHRPVMLNECISALNIHPEGIYVDATFGGGGHSLALLENLKGGRLIAFDRDSHARQEVQRIVHKSFSFHEASFVYMKRHLKLEGLEKVNGIIADLGVSSHQIDTANRGFSTRYDGPLDMRMDNNTTLTAATVLNTYSEKKLYAILKNYGELKNAKTLARTIVQSRVDKPLARSADLLEVLQPMALRGKVFKYYAQVFQALRIEVNQEISALETFLQQCSDILETRGRLVVMSYHSLEDRMVKRFMRNGNKGVEPEKDIYGHIQKPFKEINRKPITPQAWELESNNRARSAKLRVAEKT